MTDTIE